MREVSQEEFDEFIARRKEIHQVIKYGRVLATEINDPEIDPGSNEVTEPNEFGYLRKSGNPYSTSDAQIGSKYFVHYEDLTDLDL